MKCPNCASDKLMHDPHAGEVKCSECGFVVEEIVDTGQEWRAYSEEQRLARARAEPVRPLTQLSTVIGWTGTLSPERRREFARLSRAQSFVAGDERSIVAGGREVARIAAAVQLPQRVREEAQRLFVVAQRAGLLKACGVTAMAVACLVLACREYGLPDPAAKLFEVASVDPQKVRRSYALLLRHVSGKVVLKPPTPLKYVPMIAGELNLSPKVQQAAARIIKAAEDAKILLGKPPRSVAAAALYIAALIHGEGRRRRQEFAEAAEVTETTLRKRAKELLKKLELQIHI